jgi:hypothetical protein
MRIIVALLGAGAFVSWIVAVVSAIAMVKHRAPGISIAYLATHGGAFFRAESFTPSAAPHRRRFVRAFVTFFAILLAAALALALAEG